jgi:hypothetical protein
MPAVSASRDNFTVKAYRGDSKTLLAFNIDKAGARSLAGFTIACAPKGQAPYYLYNSLRFKDPGVHAQDPSEPPYSSVNAPLHKFRWIHVPGSFHQGLKPYFGDYSYTVTPRYFDDAGHLLPIDARLGATVVVELGPYTKGKLSLGFARGFTQSQAFSHRFGKDALIRPKGDELLFDTSQVAGRNESGETYTFREEYDWLGFSARDLIFELLDEVKRDRGLQLDVFAYDLNEPDIMRTLIDLGREKRVRIILDDADLHHDKPPKPDEPPKPAEPHKPEDLFEKAFNAAVGDGSRLLRGHFARYSHDKVFVVSRGGAPIKVLTGSTNFSVTGIYVNSNHVLVLDDPEAAGFYAEVFEEAWRDKVKAKPFRESEYSQRGFSPSSPGLPPMAVAFAPHNQGDAMRGLQEIAARVKREESKPMAGCGCVLFAVMAMSRGDSPVWEALNAIHENRQVFSYGISDSPEGINLYKSGSRQGLLVTGKPVKAVLPPPFDQVREIYAGHQVHHKFVVCGFNSPDAAVFFGSSNLAVGGEKENGDNLICIRDEDVAVVFAIEAIGLVDHFNFLDKCATGGAGSAATAAKRQAPANPSGTPRDAAEAAGWFLSTDDGWTRPYFDPNDLKSVDRELFC